VNGVDTAWQALSGLARAVDTEAIVSGACCSAAYYLASALPTITSDAPSNELGSIGVLIAYTSWKKADECFGVKEIIITSSNAPNKAPDPETKKGLQVILDRIDAMERIFYMRISEGRGVSTQDIAERFGKGGVMVSYDPDPDRPDAVTVGMIDAVLGLDTEEMDSKSTTNLEEQSMPTLAELMQSDGSIRADVEAREKAAVVKAEQSIKDKHASLVDKVSPYLSSEYPKAIHKLALNVLKGEYGQDALMGAVAYHDSQKELAAEQAAANETNEAGETPAGDGNQPTPSEDGTVKSEVDLDAAIKRDRERRGIAVK
jgi:hypothetical protein